MSLGAADVVGRGGAAAPRAPSGGALSLAPTLSSPTARGGEFDVSAIPPLRAFSAAAPPKKKVHHWLARGSAKKGNLVGRGTKLTSIALEMI